MNIHEYQAKEILKEFGAPVSRGIVVSSADEIKKISQLDDKQYVLKLKFTQEEEAKQAV